jgi:hypothetical protein
MAFKLFNKKKAEEDPQLATGGNGDDSADDGKDTAKDAKDDGFHPDERKALAFFRHATTTADSRQWDYSIECFVNGLRHDPENMTRHEELYNVALRRKNDGGKKAGLTDQFKGGGKHPIDKMMHAEKMWAKEPANLPHMVAFMERAAEANQKVPEVDLSEVVYWVAMKVVESNARADKPKQEVYVKARDVLSGIRMFGEASQAGRLALQLGDDNGQLLRRVKELEAEATIEKGRLDEKGVSAIQTQRDSDAQSIRNLQDQTGLTDEQADHLIGGLREQWEKEPEDSDMLLKLVRALAQREKDKYENEAVDLLQKEYKRSDEYRFHVMAGDLRMKQYRRKITELRKMLKQDPDDDELKQQIHDLSDQQLKFELKEYEDRVNKYPTQLDLKYHLGRRKVIANDLDEAIGLFQEAHADPKLRSQCGLLLGQCYLKKEWNDEAIDTLKIALESHALVDDGVGKELRYLLLEGLERQARKHKNIEMAREAQKVASKLLQSDINYRDIRQRVDNLRKLVDELMSSPASG